MCAYVCTCVCVNKTWKKIYQDINAIPGRGLYFLIISVWTHILKQNKTLVLFIWKREVGRQRESPSLVHSLASFTLQMPAVVRPHTRNWVQSPASFKGTQGFESPLGASHGAQQQEAGTGREASQVLNWGTGCRCPRVHLSTVPNFQLPHMPFGIRKVIIWWGYNWKSWN